MASSWAALQATGTPRRSGESCGREEALCLVTVVCSKAEWAQLES